MNKLLLAGACIALLTACDQAQEEAVVEEAVPLVSGIDLSGFDTSVRPQDDFNRYVNGGWLDANEIPADRRSWGAFSILAKASEENQRAIIEELAAMDNLQPGTDEQRVGDLFASYMNTARANELGAAPVMGDIDAIMAAGSANELLRLNAEDSINGAGSPLGFFFYTDLGDSTRYMFYLVQSGLTLPDRDYYLKDDERFADIRAALPGYAATLFGLAGVDNAEARGSAVLEVERRIAEIHWPAEETRDIERLYNLYKVGDLATASDKIDWTGLLAALGLEAREQIVIGQPSYTQALGGLLDELSLDDLKSYYAFRVLHANAAYLSEAFVDARFQFTGQKVQGLEVQPERWLRGVRNVNGQIGHAVGKVYVVRHFPPEAKVRMEGLVNNLIVAFRGAIDGLEWMTDGTKAKAQEKRLKFNYKIGYPDVWQDYSGLTIDKDDLVGNVMRANAFEYNRQLKRMDEPIDKTEWGMTPQTVNAYYSPGYNEIVFPAAILQPPFFDLVADDAVNYGAIGAVIGHEIGHAFDDQGRKFDGDGNLVDWWSETDATAFEAAANNLVEQYNQYSPLEGLNVNGQLTLGENIGDLTGVTISYRAYVNSLDGKEAPLIDGLTGAQRFFIGYAQAWRTKYRDELMQQLVVSNPHSPPEFRVLGALRNSLEFYEAFDVKEGDGMYLPPEERVKIW